MTLALVWTLLCCGAGTPEPAPIEPAPPAPAPARSATESRVLSELDARLADGTWTTGVNQEASRFYEGQLFPHVFPVLAMANLSRRPGEDPAALRARMAPMIDRLIPETAKRLGVDDPAAIPGVAGHGTWQGQLALTLGAWRLAGGDDRYEALHRALCEALLARLQARAGAPIDAYPGMVWTFDTVPVLLALRLRDQSHGLPGAADAIAAHLAWADAHLDAATGLPPARVTLDRYAVREGPRGCDIALRVALLAQLDPARAGAMYEAFKAHFSVETGGLVGFAEWPDGAVGRPDPDSGPVLFGLGMAATGFGLAAARAAGDAGLAGRLEAELVAMPSLLGPLRSLVDQQAKQIGIPYAPESYLTGSLFGDVALLYSLSWEPWPL